MINRKVDKHLISIQFYIYEKVDANVNVAGELRYGQLIFHVHNCSQSIECTRENMMKPLNMRASLLRSPFQLAVIRCNQSIHSSSATVILFDVINKI